MSNNKKVAEIQRMEKQRRLIEESAEALSGVVLSNGSFEITDPHAFYHLDLTPKPLCQINFRDDRPGHTPAWADYIDTIHYKDGPKGEFLEIIFRTLNAFVLGYKVGRLLPLIKNHATDICEDMDGTRRDAEGEGVLEPHQCYIEYIYLNETGHGKSLYKALPATAQEIRVLQDLLPGRELSLGSEDTEVLQMIEEKEMSLLADFGFGEEELGIGQPVNEAARRSVQHKKLIKEKKAAKEEDRKMDPKKLH